MLTAYVCPLCGGKLEKIENKNKCKYCATIFEEGKAERFADKISELLDSGKQEKLANLKNLLWKELHEKNYIDSERIVDITNKILELYPDDKIAELFNLANSDQIKKTAERLSEFDVKNYGYAVEWVLDFIIKSLEPLYILPANDLIERAFKNNNEKYKKYVDMLSIEAEKVEEGIYTLTTPRDVFLCYSSKDMAKVLELAAVLEEEGISCFIASKNLRHGAGAVQNYQSAIEKAIEYCKILVFISSENSRRISCDAVKFEIPYIRKKDIERAPVEYTYDYEKMPINYKKPRVEYLLDNYADRLSAIDKQIKEFFSGNEWCRAAEDVRDRIVEILTNGWATDDIKENTYKESYENSRLIEEQKIRIKELEEEKERIRQEAEEKLKAKFLAEEKAKLQELEKEKDRIRKEAEEKEKLLVEKEQRLKELENKKIKEGATKKVVSHETAQNTVFSNTQPDYDAEIQKAIEEERRRTEELERKIKEAEEEANKIEAEAKRKEEEERQRKERDEKILKAKQEEQARQEALKKQLEEIENKKRELKFKSIGIKIEGDSIWFGSYPQSEVKDTAIKNALTALAGNLPTFDDPQKWTSYGYYIENKKQDYIWYIDIEYNEEKYRGVYFTKYRPYLTMGQSQESNTYQKANGYTVNTVYWFAYEPIKWRILRNTNGEALILSESIIDSKQYCHYKSSNKFDHNGGKGYPNNYALSDIRKWLNDTFYETAFTPLQKELIKLTTVDNGAKSTSDNKGELPQAVFHACGNTQDKVFLLSLQEVTDSAYKFDEYPKKEDSMRRKQNTDYSKSQGCYLDADSYNDNGDWWLRSPDYNDSFYARNVDYNGNADDNTIVNASCNGVVPALVIDLNAIDKPSTSSEDKKAKEKQKDDTKLSEKQNLSIIDKSALIKSKGDYIWFGSYPQSEVKDETIKSALTKLAGTLPTENNSQKWTSYGYYIEGKKQDYMWYIDLEYKGKKYRGIYFNKYRPRFTTEKSQENKTHQKDNGYTLNTVYWFAYEPIKWRILRQFYNGEALILSEMNVDSQEYYHEDVKTSFNHNGGTGYANNYALSNIRKWLNDTFYNTAFTSLQKEIIKITTVDNSARSTSGSKGTFVQTEKYACDNTQDKVFLLSLQEVTESAYKFSTNPAYQNSVRQKKNTDYAKSQGCWTNAAYNNSGCWLLRTPYGGGAISARHVSVNGKSDGDYYVYVTQYGVAPALVIKLE